MLQLSTEEEHRHIFELILTKEGIDPHTRSGVGISTLVIEYICHKLCPAAEKGPSREMLSSRIRKFRPATEIHRKLGDGILILVGDNTRDLLTAVSSDKEVVSSDKKAVSSDEGPKFKRYQKLGYIADCLLKCT